MQGLQTLSQDEEEEVHGEVSRIVPSIQKSKATPLTDRITFADGLQGYQPRRRVGHAGGGGGEENRLFPQRTNLLCVALRYFQEEWPLFYLHAFFLN